MCAVKGKKDSKYFLQLPAMNHKWITQVYYQWIMSFWNVTFDVCKLMNWRKSLAMAFQWYNKLLHSVVLGRVFFLFCNLIILLSTHYVTFITLIDIFLVNDNWSISVFHHILQVMKFSRFLWCLVIFFFFPFFFKKTLWWSSTSHFMGLQNP